MLSEFIEKLKNLDSESSVIKYIPNKDDFITSLVKLDEMIGMKEVKNNVISQVKYYLINKSRNINSIEKQEFFHTVLLGPPGSGKTTAAEILADIWINMGVLSANKSKKKNQDENDEQVMKSQTYKKLLEKNEENLKKLITLSGESMDKSKKLYNIKDDIFYNKKCLQDIKKIIEDNSNELSSDFVNLFSEKLNNFEYRFEALLKENYNAPNFKIENLTDDDYNQDSEKLTCDIRDDDSLDSSETRKTLAKELNEDIQFSTLLKETFDFQNLFAKRFEKPENLIDENVKVLKFRRDDLVGKFVGHTAVKTREALMKGIGKVIFLDEAYELYNTSTSEGGDAFGMECLNTILHFMNEYSDKCIIIFAGYEDLLKKTIFRVQPGLERRIGWTFNITPYNHNELAEIYEKQLKEKSWNLDKKDKKKIAELFKKNGSLFKNGGGDTLRLAMYTKTVYSNVTFEKLLNSEEITSDITYEIVDKAVEILRTNIENQGEKSEELSYYT